MLIPLGTSRARRRTPWVTYALMTLCVAVHFGFVSSGTLGGQGFLNLAVARAEFEWWQLFSSAFLHGGLLHLAFNMIVLAALGPNVEDKLGHFGFILLYAAGAAASGGAHLAFSQNPAVGASGAIAAVTGAFLVLFPASRINCFMFFITFIGRVAVPAWWFIGLNIAIDLLAGSFGGNTGIAHAAHLGGYGFGIASMMLLLQTGVLKREPGDLFTILRQRKRRADIQAAVRDQQDRVKEQMKRGQSRVESPELERKLEARNEVARLIRRNDLAAAVSAYERFVDDYEPGSPGTSLPADLQLRLAEHLISEDRPASAAAAFKSFIAGNAAHPQAGSSELMLGLLLTRQLGRPAEARGHVQKAVERLVGEEKAIAEQLLAEINAAAPETDQP
ncbi:MAG: rhomboid family intramembrane serine protease [Planctomycetota bacterium]